MKATKVTAGPAESNGSLLRGLWRDSLHVTCRLTACTPGSAPAQRSVTSMGKLYLFLQLAINIVLYGPGPCTLVLYMHMNALVFVTLGLLALVLLIQLYIVVSDDDSKLWSHNYLTGEG